MHDRYRNWYIPYQVQPVIPARKSIEQQVLEDLTSAGNEMEKLEILDSYAAYAQRYYRAMMIEGFTQVAGRLATSIFGPWLRELLPEVQAVIRAAKAKE